MNGVPTTELLVTREGERTLLLSPEVGYLTCALARGRVVVAGQEVGRIRTLGVSRALLVPDGVRGRVAGDPPESVHSPCEYGQTVYELEPLGDDAPETALEPGAAVAPSALVVRSPHAGRFWHRSAPGDPPLAAEGTLVGEGQPLGLIEVMKTFAHVAYRATAGLPARARIVRVLVADGAEAQQGQALFEVEPA